MCQKMLHVIRKMIMFQTSKILTINSLIQPAGTLLLVAEGAANPSKTEGNDCTERSFLIDRLSTILMKGSIHLVRT